MIKLSHNKIDSIYTKILNKTNSQTRCLKVKNIIYFRTEGVHRCHLSGVSKASPLTRMHCRAYPWMPWFGLFIFRFGLWFGLAFLYKYLDEKVVCLCPFESGRGGRTVDVEPGRFFFILLSVSVCCHGTTKYFILKMHGSYDKITILLN